VNAADLFRETGDFCGLIDCAEFIFGQSGGSTASAFSPTNKEKVKRMNELSNSLTDTDCSSRCK